MGIKNTAIVEELALPPVKVHCSVLAEDAIKAAIKNFQDKQDAEETELAEKGDAVRRKPRSAGGGRPSGAGDFGLSRRRWDRFKARQEPPHGTATPFEAERPFHEPSTVIRTSHTRCDMATATERTEGEDRRPCGRNTDRMSPRRRPR